MPNPFSFRRLPLAAAIVLVLAFSLAGVALAAALGPGQYGPDIPDISYVNPSVGWHAAGNPFYAFDSASWSVTGGDQMQVHKNVWGGGGQLCMDGTTCQSFGFTDTYIAMNLPDRGTHSFTMTNGVITFIVVVVDNTPPVTTASPSGAAGSGGWYLSPVTVSLSAADLAGAFPDSFVSGVASTAMDGSPYAGPATYSTDGSHSFTYQSTDNRSNVETLKTMTVNIDTVAPATTYTLAGTTGSGGWYVSPVTVTLTASDATSGVAGVTLDGSPYTAPFVITTEGSSTHNFNAGDVAGNVEAAQSFALQIDTALPASAVTAPASGPVRGVVTLSGSASDATSGVAGVDISIDGGATWSATGGTTTWTHTLDTTLLPDGNLTVLVRANDVAGNAQPVSGAGSTALTLLVDNTAPAASLSADPIRFCSVCGASTHLSYSVADPASGVQSWTLSVDGVGTLASGSGDASSVFDWNGASLPLGPYTARLSVTDAASNTAEQTVALSLLPNIPTVSLNISCSVEGANGWCRAPVTVSIAGGSQGSSIGTLNFVFDGEARSVNGAEHRFEVGSGSHTVSDVASVDLFGQSSPPASGSFKIDGAPPSLNFTGASAGGLAVSITDTESGVRTWTVQAFDAVSGVSVFYADGRGPFTGAVPASLAPGSYQVEIFASDEAGNEASFGRASFTIVAPPTPTPTPGAIEQIFNWFAGPTAPPPTAAPTMTATPLPTPTAPPPAVAVVVQNVEPEPQKIIPIAGVVFRDANGNGVQDAGEPGVAGARVEIVTPGGATQTLVTDASGAYSATVLAGKRYLLRIVSPLDLLLTTPGSAIIFENAASASVNFGLNAQQSIFLLLLLFCVLALLLAWLVSAALDRRGSAMAALGAEVETLFAVRQSQSPADDEH